MTPRLHIGARWAGALSRAVEADHGGIGIHFWTGESSSKPGQQRGLKRDSTMPRTCTICRHPMRDSIDEGLVGGQSYRSIARRFEASPPAVYRHLRVHLPDTLVRATQVSEETHGMSVLKQLKSINSATLSILHEAQQSGDRATALRAVARIQRQIELQSRLLGEFEVVRVSDSAGRPDSMEPFLGDAEFVELVAQVFEKLAVLESETPSPPKGRSIADP